ncbi:syntaxin-61 isoform X1 [Nymphaea colorata]|nr:syntaxin-61 isoform X1 [Nymphaea colorata]XP_031484772.1 syntaxin-61 isoform X1 [Nymphaea colorata]XP_049933663.1 syntaxin-61 isoform X1 [Nymphaea colorata]
MMSPAQDPFYLVKQEIQESIDKLLSTFRRWEQIESNTGEYVHLSKELVAGCESIEWQVDELEKAISVAESNPSRFGIDEIELGKRKRWTTTSRTQVASVRKAVDAAPVSTNKNGIRRELTRLTAEAGRSDQYPTESNDDYISSETDRQMLLIRQQDQELDELSASVERIGGVGLTIHEELLGQEKILEDLNQEMDSTSNRLDFVQKKVAMVMKKAGAKGQIMMIVFLLVLFIILFVLVFLT